MSFSHNCAGLGAYESRPDVLPLPPELEIAPGLSAQELAAGIATSIKIQHTIGNIAYRFGADADDLGQDLCVRVLTTEGRLPPELDQAAAWVNTVARNIATDGLRRNSRRPQIVEHELDENRAGTVDSTGDVENKILVESLLGGLSDRRRQILSLYYLKDYTQPEIAEMLGIPLNTVKSEVFQGIKDARRRLSKLDLT